MYTHSCMSMRTPFHLPPLLPPNLEYFIPQLPSARRKAGFCLHRSTCAVSAATTEPHWPCSTAIINYKTALAALHGN